LQSFYVLYSWTATTFKPSTLFISLKWHVKIIMHTVLSYLQPLSKLSKLETCFCILLDQNVMFCSSCETV